MILEHLLQWWNLANRSIWELEQRDIQIQLKEWALSVRDQPNIELVNPFTRVLGNYWKTTTKQLLSELSPLDSFCFHPFFADAMEQGTFKNWIQAEMTQLFKLGNNRQMYSETKLAEMIPTMSKNLFHFQFLQVKSLIDHLLTLGNVFRPLTALSN